jgi:diacylglycerol kinase (ATP)
VSGIGVIVNPSSKRNRGRTDLVVSGLEDILGDEGQVFACGDLETLLTALTTLKREDISVLAICGGDGTYSYIMGHAEAVFGAEALPPVALLRGGTMNTTANGLGVAKGTPHKLLKTLVGHVRAQRTLVTQPRPLMRGGDRLGCLFGTGLVVRYLQEYYRRGRPHPTPWTAFTTLSSAALSAVVGGPLIRHMAAPERLELTIDGERLPVADYVTIAAGTVPEFGLGFAPFPGCLDDPHRFHMLGTTVSPAAFLLDLSRMRTGRSMSPDHGLVTSAQTLTLTPTDGSERLLVMFDGDVMHLPAPLTISVGPIVNVIMGAEERPDQSASQLLA